MILPHPVQYQGSKRNLAQVILRYFPKKVNRIVEPFAGTAAISIAAAAKQISQRFWMNDINSPLIKLLELIIEHPEEIADFYSELWNEQHNDSVEHYCQVREQFNRTQEPKFFLYLLARCAKGSVRYNAEGLFNQSPDKRRKGTRPETMKKNIFGVSFLLKGKCIFSDMDYKEVLQSVDHDDLVYMDPPYQGVCGERDSRYYAGITFDDFVNALEELNKRKIAFIVSYDGRRGEKSFGNPLPDFLNLTKIEIEAGRSSQATLLGREEITVESLYLSSALSGKCNKKRSACFYPKYKTEQIPLTETYEKQSAFV
ncbi:MAG: Dam family site-specific DNA-(adenine-N6)-methyltransferase [Desulfobacterales bacterium]